MLSTYRIALAAIMLAAPVGVVHATTLAEDDPTSSVAVVQNAEPGFGIAQADTPDRQGGGMAMHQPSDEEEDEGGATGRGMMGHDMMCDHGMMGHGMHGGMQPMMQMMQGMMQTMHGMMQMMEHQSAGHAAHGRMHGMMPGKSVEEHLAAMKAELGITQAQEPQWNAFADAVRARMKAMQDMRDKMMAMMRQRAAASWPDRLAEHERRLSARLEAVKAMEGPVKGLWDALSDEQRQKAQAMMPMGMR